MHKILFVLNSIYIFVEVLRNTFHWYGIDYWHFGVVTSLLCRQHIRLRYSLWYTSIESYSYLNTLHTANPHTMGGTLRSAQSFRGSEQLSFNTYLPMCVSGWLSSLKLQSQTKISYTGRQVRLQQHVLALNISVQIQFNFKQAKRLKMLTKILSAVFVYTMKVSEVQNWLSLHGQKTNPPIKNVFPHKKASYTVFSVSCP